jgi:hypothetical protein
MINHLIYQHSWFNQLKICPQIIEYYQNKNFVELFFSQVIFYELIESKILFHSK